MKIISSLLLIIFFSGCKSVTTSIITTEDNSVIMNTSEKSLFSCPSEKVKLAFSPKNGGQIISIYWEGEKIAGSVSESYLNINELSPRVIDDGSGFIIVDSNVRGKYRLRRSYNLVYNEESDEHIIEVIYNVKNYLDKVAISQQWVQNLSLSESLNLTVNANKVKGLNKDTSFIIETIDVKDLTITKSNQHIKLSNAKEFDLGFKERLSWKVIYKLRSLD